MRHTLIFQGCALRWENDRAIGPTIPTDTQDANMFASGYFHLRYLP
ncbi:MAG: hypothetical protein ACLP9L_16325 [Thermoguttaceae bacterium]